MAIQLSVQAIGATVGNCVGFAAKQSFCYYCLSGVRNELDTIISQIASHHFGQFVGRAVGSHISFIASIPCTLFLGDLIWSTLNEIIQSTVWFSARTFGIIEKQVRALPMWADTALRVSSAVTGYFAKCACIHFSMPIIKAGIETFFHQGIAQSAMHPAFRHAFHALAPMGAVVVTPVVTFMAADLLGGMIQAATYTGTHSMAMIAYNAYQPTKPSTDHRMLA